MKITHMNNSFRVTLLATVLTVAFATSTSAVAGNASTSTHLKAQQAETAERTPMFILSQKVGDVGREAIGSGVQTVRSAEFEHYPGLKIIYADVNSIEKDKYREVVNSIRTALNGGNFVALETSEFDFPLLKNFIMQNFPEIDISEFNDVAVLLRLEGKKIRAERIDPTELAMYAGIPYAEIASRLPSIPADQGVIHSKAYIGGKINLDLAIQAYDDTPTYTGWTLKYDGTYVDLWESNTGQGVCTVAWRGTVKTNLHDVYADLTSQAYFSASINNVAGVSMKGGNGFVQRLHAYDDTLKNKFTSAGCISIVITGHSLGAAVASIHALQLAHDPDWRVPLNSVVAWNSPNVISAATQRDRLAELNKHAVVHVNCRLYDWLVNPLPTGLHRIGNPDSTPVKGCTFVKTGTTWSTNPNANHAPDLWRSEF